MNFESSGKLLITGEYLILQGANALAVPLQFKQSLEIKKSDVPGFHWTAKENGATWFELQTKTPLFEIIKTTDKKKASALIDVFKAVIKLNPAFKTKIEDMAAITHMDFDRSWGFGSSSSLISNIAYWADVDPFELHKLVSRGSGYDVVTARSNGPVIFNRDGDYYATEKVGFNPAFNQNIFFVYLGEKQNSAKSVLQFTKRRKSFNSEIELISDITKHISLAKSIEDFEFYLKEHEQIMSSVLRQKPIKETIFKNLQGEAKSLGAWGGDFAMLTWQYGKSELLNYLESKNLKVAFKFDELIKTW